MPQIRSLEDTLHETEARYGQEVGGHNSRIQQLEGELGQVRAQVEGQTAEYQALLNIKMKLEAEIATYHSLLEGVGEDKGDNNRLEMLNCSSCYVLNNNWIITIYSNKKQSPVPHKLNVRIVNKA